MDLFAALDHLWEDTAAHQSQPTLRRWAGPEPVMGRFADLDDLVEVAQDAVTDPRRDAALAALSRLARSHQTAQLTTGTESNPLPPPSASTPPPSAEPATGPRGC